MVRNSSWRLVKCWLFVFSMRWIIWMVSCLLIICCCLSVRWFVRSWLSSVSMWCDCLFGLFFGWFVFV